MEIRQIEYAVGVLEHGGFTRAAAALHVSQPALSEGVARLEADLGVALFDRVGRGVIPTAAAEAFAAPARRVLQDLMVLRTTVAAVVGVEGGSIDVVALPTLAADPLPAIVGHFRREHPLVTVTIAQPERADAAVDQVRAGRAEVGLVELPVTTPDLDAEELFVQDYVVVLPPGSPLGTRRRIKAASLDGVPLVTTPTGTSTRRMVEAAFAQAAVVPAVAVETDQREAIVPLVLAGAGASILPEPLARGAEAAGAHVVRLDPPLRRRVGIITRSGPRSPAAEALLGAARAVTRGAVPVHGR